MQKYQITPQKALNDTYKRQKPIRNEIESFKTNLIQLLDKADESKLEEYLKNLVSDFLKNTYYRDKYDINIKGRNDLVILNGKEKNSSVGVILEAKKPSNKTEMVTSSNLNAKAFQELVLYFLRERITLKNHEVKHLVITNFYEWYIFDAKTFDKYFAQNKELVKKFQDFEAKTLSDTKTDFFYKEIASAYIEAVKSEIEFTYFNLKDYETILRNENLKDDVKLISLFKLLSPQHLLKLPLDEQRYNLDKTFYSEFLHIVGLTEVKEGGKKLIQRQEPSKRKSGTILEETINQIDVTEKIHRLDNPSQFGKTKEERLFNLSLELSITWINRILFLKLLEAQLLTYHKGDSNYTFLNYNKINSFDDLNSLFFQVLARKHSDRSEEIKKRFEKVPYLNSSLFELTELEDKTFMISAFSNSKKIPIKKDTVLRDRQGKKRTGEINTLEYLFAFLDAYDFSSEGAEEIQEENKSLINASVLGLIFEKLNGYKDGSYFTPGFITMYMCRETIRKAVVQKFNDRKSWNCENLDDVYNKIEDHEEANHIINDLKICDPAVGSGHFLVSALNEIIAIKSDLKILTDTKGRKLKEYEATVDNDELVLKDEDGNIFQYDPRNKEKQRVQEALFHEKQTIIENCLFGVDINPNSVKICRLRLWIELLKHAYYKNETELETLPNIDINIKCGNSLISRFPLDVDLGKALKKSEWNVKSYRKAVDTYRNAETKEQKWEMEEFIANVKDTYRSEFAKNDKLELDLKKIKGNLFNLVNTQDLFDTTDKQKKDLEKQITKLKEDEAKKEKAIEEIRSNKIFENAFEWRFEFPEVLDDDGNFKGFDVVIGNPPYIGIEDISWDYRRFYETIFNTAKGRFDLYSLFIEKVMQLKKNSGSFTFIIPGKFLNNKQFALARKKICENHGVSVIKIDNKVFEDAQVDSVIVENYPVSKQKKPKYKAFNINMQELKLLSQTDVDNILKDKQIVFRLEINSKFENLISKLETNSLRVKDIGEVKDGIVAGAIKDILFLDKKIDRDYHKLYFGKNISRYHLGKTKTWVNYKPDEMMKEEIKRQGKKRTGLWMRDKKIFEREKIIYRKVGKELIATYAEKGIYYEQTIHSCHITDKRFKTKFVLGLFNSTLFKFYYRKTNSQGGDIFPQVRISSVENLPIKLADTITQEKFETVVNHILIKKAQDFSVDTTDLESQIDQLVYQLYELTPEEIKIVEGSVK
ncbi:MAG: Eco57I restriction-modification methylase domain-containing protein [Leptospiraceae bacterium]|nr:Eco57I restriction-modification methylase domain-containing protein [Leptospiraceae bacterium]